MPPLQLDRPDFLDHVFDYRRGEHAAWIYPTGKGKSTLAYQCADVAMRQNPDLDFVSMMPKSKSPTTARWARDLNLRETPSWPPQKHFWEAEPRGHVLWPPHRKDLTAAENRAQLGVHFRKALHEMLWQGDCIAFADDLHRLAVLLDCNTECEEWWTTGAEAGAGLWGANQKPSGTLNSGSVSSFFYNSSAHMFFGRDTDQRNVRRFGEIGGGVDPAEIADIVGNLRLYPINGKTVSEVLYLDTRGAYMCLVGP
jgi:hypothetical protein